MNAYEYYLSTCKYVLLANPSDKSSWVDLYSYLPCLRQMMSCCVCGNIMLKPKGPGHGYCLHHVCSACIGGKMRLRPACSWCRTHDGFVDNPGMRLLILCYKKMCVFINNSAIGEQIRKSVANGAHTNTLIRVLDEAVAFEDDYVISNKVMPTCVPTYGMAPEPKLVSFPRGSQGHTPGDNSVKISSRTRRDSALSDSVQSHTSDDLPPPLTKNADEKHSSISDLNGDELEKMPALLAPCTRSFMSPEKNSPSLPEPQNGDILDQEDQWIHVTRSGHCRGDRIQAPLATSLDTNIATSGQKFGKKLCTSKLKRGSASPQAKGKTGDPGIKYQKKKHFKHDIDFEPPCKRTRHSSSLASSGAQVQSSEKMCTCAHLNSPNSRLTCFEGCCPCYRSQLPCVSCGCRGCRNPCKESTALLRNSDNDKSDAESDPAMPILSPEPRL